jgi:AraC-like DNA-binding protein
MIKTRPSLPEKPESAGVTYKLYAPHPLLKPFVSCYWVLRTGARFHNQQLLIPDGYVDLIFNYGQAYLRTEFDSGLPWKTIDQSHIVGERAASVLVENNAHMDLFGVKLNPYGLWALTNIPAKEFSNEIVPLNDLPASFTTLENQIYHAPGDTAKIFVVEEFLAKKLLLFSTENIQLQTSTKLIIQSKGKISISALANEVNMPYKTLERAYNRFVGLSPKSFSRIIRFKKALRAINKAPDQSQPLYLDYGYYDQNHFIKEFKHFMGGTPSEYFNRQFHVEDKIFLLGTNKNTWAFSEKPEHK